MSHLDCRGLLCCLPMGWSYMVFQFPDETRKHGDSSMSLVWWNKTILQPRPGQVRERQSFVAHLLSIYQYIG